MRRHTFSGVIGIVCAIAAAIAPERASPAAEVLRIASWNMEWLLTPATLQSLTPRCSHEGEEIAPDERVLPCDVAEKLARTAGDFAALRDYAHRLNADVVALQEVDGAAAARLIFPDYDFCFTKSRILQNTGFAFRRERHIAFRCDPDIRELGLRQGRLRYGAQATLFPATAQELHLLSVHLKSGCAAAPLTDRTDACRMLSAQVPVLERWIDAQAGSGRRFLMLGDFNRRLTQEPHHARDRYGRLLAFWPEINAGLPSGARLVNATAAEGYSKCHPRESFDAYIDHIVAGSLAAQHLNGSHATRVTYSEADWRRFRLSDHCPIAIDYHF
jgi:endonuclease/exonuclease/phosphatase family metal-dependent hydrolase